MDPSATALIILLVVVVLYVTEAIPIAVTTVLACLALVWLQVVPFEVAFSGFASDTLWLVVGMIMVGASIFETGLASLIGKAVISKIGSSENAIIAVLLPLVMAMSAFLNNSSTTATFTPVVQAVSAGSKGKVRAKLLLMPLAFAATTGGMLTLVGSTPQLIVNGVMKEMSLPPFGFFEFAWIGAPLGILLLAYSLTVGKRLAEWMWEDQIDQTAAKTMVPAEATPTVKTARSRRQMWKSASILVFCIVGFILQPQLEDTSLSYSLGTIAVTGAMLTVLTGCFSLDRLYALTDWTTFFVLGGAIGFGAGLTQSGAGRLVADTTVALVGGASPFIVFAVFLLVAMALTQMMSNTATAAMMAPIGIFVAQGMGFNPVTLMMGLAMATAAAYMTPVGTPPNTIVLGAGGYRFMDYVKVGGLFQLISFVTVSILVPIIWPL